MAIPNSAGHPARPAARRLAALAATWLFVTLGVVQTPAAAELSTNASPAARVQRIYKEARERWRKEGTNAEAAWQLGRAAFDYADLATNDARRAEIAEEGIAACRESIRLQPALAPPHYYLALNLGQSARTKLLGALKLVEEMEEQFKKAIELDPKFDYAGAHRSLGELYSDAPGWPASIGSRNKARQHLEKAVQLFPEYPGNRICLLESLVKWGDKKAVQSQLASTEEFLKEARTKFTGDRWVTDWQDWDQRWEKIKAKAAVVATREE